MSVAASTIANANAATTFAGTLQTAPEKRSAPEEGTAQVILTLRSNRYGQNVTAFSKPLKINAADMFIAQIPAVAAGISPTLALYGSWTDNGFHFTTCRLA